MVALGRMGVIALVPLVMVGAALDFIRFQGALCVLVPELMATLACDAGFGFISRQVRAQPAL